MNSLVIGYQARGVTHVLRGASGANPARNSRAHANTDMIVSDNGSLRRGGRTARVMKAIAYNSARNNEGIVRLDVAKADGEKKVSVVIPLNYASMLGLRGRDLYLDPIINTAYDDLFHQTLNPGYSPIAKLGKEKLLYAAREALRSVRGRVSLVHPDVTVEPVLLPGTMALLNQLGYYEMAIQVAEQVKNISARDLKATNKGTLKEYKRDIALAAALANCGLAKVALEGGSVSLGYARLEEAFSILESSGGRGLSPELYTDIHQALADLKSDAVIDTLKESLDLGSVTNRKSAIEIFAAMLKGSQPGITPEFVMKVLSYMTSIEIIESMDWMKILGSNTTTSPWISGEIASFVGVAHLVGGFAYRRPYLVAKARKIFISAHRMQADVAIPMAVSEILLGETNTAIGILLEDERLGAKLRGAAHLSQQNAKAYPVENLPDRDEVMSYIRYNSPGPSNDVLPGVCTFVQLWLRAVAFPRVRDTRERPVSPSLAEYFDAPGTARYLMSRSRGFGDIIAPVLAFFGRHGSTLAGAGNRAINVASSAVALPIRVAGRMRGSLASMLRDEKSRNNMINVGAGLLGLYFAIQFAGKLSQAGPSLRTRFAEKSSTANPVKNNGPIKPRRISGNKSQRSSMALPLSKDDARKLIESWLNIKSQAMGPRHLTQDLAFVLDEPMLSAVLSEAKEAAKSGWFWNIKPLKVRVDDIESQSDGSLRVTATVDEKADLYATSGKHGDHYMSSYRVEYQLVESRSAGWKIASALVLGKP
jgi:hypothetical protein